MRAGSVVLCSARQDSLSACLCDTAFAKASGMYVQLLAMPERAQIYVDVATSWRWQPVASKLPCLFTIERVSGAMRPGFLQKASTCVGLRKPDGLRVFGFPFLFFFFVLSCERCFWSVSKHALFVRMCAKFPSEVKMKSFGCFSGLSSQSKISRRFQRRGTKMAAPVNIK